MKTFSILLITLLALNDVNAQWIQQNSGTTKNLNSVYFTDVNTGYAVGDSGIILKTIDGGANWTSQTSGTYYNLMSVHFPIADTGFVVGGSGWFGFIMKTINGGVTWSIVYKSDTIIGGNNCAFNSVYFTDINTGYVVGGFSDIVGSFHSLIRKTTDGGISWQSQSTGMETFLNSVCFTDSNIGYVVGSSIFKTIDGGTTWTVSSSECGGSSVYFADPNTGFAVGSGMTFAKTIDAGTTWTCNGGATFTDHLSGVSFTDVNTGYAVGWTSVDGIGVIYKTNDGGGSWSLNFYFDEFTGLSSVFFTGVDTGYAVGYNGTILKTTNGGVGINDQNQTASTPTIYPDPVTDKITIETTSKGQLSILNPKGQVIQQQEITGPTTTVDVNELKSGVYFVRLTGDRLVKVGKFIKQ